LPKSRRTISGRTAVISGAASGMGRSLAQRLSAYGSPVAITDIDERGLKETEARPGDFVSAIIDAVEDDYDFAATALAISDRYRPAPPLRAGRVLPVTTTVGSFGR